MVSIFRGILAVIVGLLAGMILVFVGESLGHLAYPPPAGLDVSKPETIAEYMKTMPALALVPVLLSWAAASFGGAWVAAKIAPRRKLRHGMIIGVFFLAASVANMLMIPHPTWAWVVGLGEALPIAYLGAWFAVRRPAATRPPVAA